MYFWPKWSETKLFTFLFTLFFIFLITYLAGQSYVIYKQSKVVGEPEPMQHEIMVEGQAKLKMTPDLATVNFGVESKADNVTAAQNNNTEKMNQLIENVKGLGIAEEDIQTTYYNAYENEVWDPDTRDYVSKGWIVSQTVQVDIRDLEKVSSVLATVGQYGATNITGPNFTIEDPNKFRDEARQLAVKNAKENAERLRETLGIEFEKVIGYDEWIGGGGVFPKPLMADRAVGLGSAEAMPEIEPGTEELIFNVTVRYEIKD